MNKWIIILSLVGVILFFFLMYYFYCRYQEMSKNLVLLTKKLELERLATIQLTRLASLGEMAAGVTHEINNPLAVIIGRGEMILAQIGDGSATQEEISKSISKMNEMAVRISKIVTSMRKISKGSNKNELVPTNLVSIIDDILNVSTERLRTSFINLDVTGVNAGLSVQVNFTHLSQVIINLLNNSFDELSKVPEDKRNIWLMTEEDGNGVILKIKDSGYGIPADIRGKLFEPFFTTKEVGKGTGLGLSISKGLMIGMGGDLELSPDRMQTCFILRLKKA